MSKNIVLYTTKDGNMIVYKVTDLYGLTGHNYIKHNWIEQPTLESTGEGELRTAGWVYAFEHPLLAILHDPIYTGFYGEMRLWECRAEGTIKRDGQMQLGCQKLTVLKEIPYPEITPQHRICYAQSCANIVSNIQHPSAYRATIHAERAVIFASSPHNACARAARFASQAACAAGYELNLIEIALEAMSSRVVEQKIEDVGPSVVKTTFIGRIRSRIKWKNLGTCSLDKGVCQK